MGCQILHLHSPIYKNHYLIIPMINTLIPAKPYDLMYRT